MAGPVLAPRRTAATPAEDRALRDDVAVLALFAVGFSGLYLLAAVAGNAVSEAGGLSPWFLPAGLSLAVGIRAGWWALPLIAVADTVQLLLRGTAFSAAEAVALGLVQGVIWAGIGALLARRLRAAAPFARIGDFAHFALIGVCAGSLIAATAATVAIDAFTVTAGDDGLVDRVGRVFVGDAIGLLTVTPAALGAWAWLIAQVDADGWRRPRPRAVAETVMLGVLCLVWPAITIAAWDGVLLPAAPLPLLVVALRHGMPAASYALAAWGLGSGLAYALAGGDVDLTHVNAALLAGGLMALAVGTLVCERERGRARMAFLALHDDVTGLPNSRSFADAVGRALAAATPHETVAVLVIDLPRSESVIGRSAADGRQELARKVAARLLRATSGDATIARLSARQFVVMLEGHDARHAGAVAERVLEVLRRPIAWNGIEIRLDPAVGVAYGGSGMTPSEVTEHASRAAGAAREQDATGAITLFEGALAQQVDDERALVHDLARALDRGELSLAYQPIVSCRGRRPVGAEALMRWDHPERGRVSPGRFVPVAESNGLIAELGVWSLRTAVEAATRWPRVDGRALAINVNVSPVQLHDITFSAQVAEILEHADLDPGRLCIEVTETAVMEDLDRVRDQLDELKALGLRIALDDFGTGYSSLAWLQRLPFTTLKADQSFVGDLHRSATDAAIVRATIDMARALNLDTVGEGVEVAAQLEALSGLGCDAVQGYLPCPPLSGDDLQRWLLEKSGL